MRLPSCTAQNEAELAACKTLANSALRSELNTAAKRASGQGGASLYVPCSTASKNAGFRHKCARGALPCLQVQPEQSSGLTDIDQADGENGQQSSLMADIDQTDIENELVVVAGGSLAAPYVA